MFIFGEGVIFDFYLQKVLAGIKCTSVQRVREAGSRGKVLHQGSAEAVYSVQYRCTVTTEDS